MLRKERGVYLMDVWFVNGSERTAGTIVVDSGAAECVMPQHMLPKSPTLERKEGVRFAAANGGEMGNYGRKMVEFIPRTELGFTRRA